ncbi:MAG: hypothetical protein KA521_08440 [Crocinitomicaceae bacterium]|nr:hypothetical protein [Crocinitomicaceae bacterium]
MKRILSYKVILVFVVLTLTACTMVHKGQIVSLDYGQEVSPQNQAVGTYSVNYLFGLGGTSTTVMLKEAKDDLIRNRPLKEGEKYVNVNLNSSTFFFLFFTKHRYSITADVVSPNSSNLTIIESSQKDTLNDLPPVISLFEKGDSLFSTFDFEGLYISIAPKEKIKYSNSKGLIKYYNENKLFKKMITYKGFKLGQRVHVKKVIPNSAEIIGFGLKKVLLVDTDRIKFSIEYSEIY